MSPKILYIDDWTRNISNFLWFDSLLRAEGCQTQMLHWTSLNDPASARVENICGIVCKDIAAYGTTNLDKILLRERPDAVVMLNCFPLMQRAVIKYGRSMSIPTVYLMHGIRTGESDVLVDSFRNAMTWRRRWRKIRKYAILFREFYQASCMEANSRFPGFESFSTIVRAIVDPAKALFGPQKQGHVACTRSLLYSEFDRVLFRDTYGIPDRTIRVIGNPKLDKVFAFKKELSTGNCSDLAMLDKVGLELRQKYALYLEEGLVAARFPGWSHGLETRVVGDISEICKNAGLHLVVKLHPSTELEPWDQTFSNSPDVTVVKDFDLDSLIWHSSIVFGQTSTTLMNVVALDKPLLIIQWIEGVQVQDFYVRHGGGIGCQTLAEFEQYLQKPERVREELVAKRHVFSSTFFPYTDGLSAQRIADQILSLAERNKEVDS